MEVARSMMLARTSRSTFGRSGKFGTSEDIELEDGVEHDIGVEDIAPGVGAHQGGE